MCTLCLPVLASSHTVSDCRFEKVSTFPLMKSVQTRKTQCNELATSIKLHKKKGILPTWTQTKNKKKEKKIEAMSSEIPPQVFILVTEFVGLHSLSKKSRKQQISKM